MQSGKCFLKFTRELAGRRHNCSLRIFFGALLSVIVILPCCMNVTASREDGLCEHHPEHTQECGFTEDEPESSCTFDCEVCKKEAEEAEKQKEPEEPKSSKQTIVSWSWESEELEWDQSAGLWKLGLPGANEEEKVTRKQLEEFLPEEISAKLEDDSEKKLKLSWDISGFPEEGAFEGSYTFTAGLPEGYVPGDEAMPLKVSAELGGGELYDVIAKHVSDWKYVSRGGSEIRVSGASDDKEDYSMDYFLDMSSGQNKMIQKIKSVLPSRIRGSGYNTNNQLVEAGFTIDGSPSFGKVVGYVNIDWADVEGVINKAGTIKDGASLTFYAEPISNDGYSIRVNSKLNDSVHTFNNPEVLNLTITLHDLQLDKHTVSSVNPLNTTVNLFDYWVDADRNGAKGQDDLLRPYEDWGHKGSDGNNRGHTGVTNWNKGINNGRLLLFGDGNIHAGFWNKGAGAVSPYGQSKAGMPGIVKSVLSKGYPVVDDKEMEKSIDQYEGISDWNLCGDHVDGNPTSVNPKNISDTVSEKWKASGNSASLDYLFDPDIKNNYKSSYKDVKGLFQIDNDGYYYYDMRRNFAEYDKDSNRFVLYDGPAVDRTDKASDGSRSVGNFFPFNTGEQVFDLVEGGKLSGNQNISSNNQVTTAGYMNHHLGMTVDVEFRQPLNGVVNTGTSNNKPMTFQFSGDDDVWIFIDDVLVLDLGGIHSEIYGTIDFSTGEVAVGQSWKTDGFHYNEDDGTVDISKLPSPVETTTLKEQFDKAGRADETLWRGNTFASNTGHTLKMFYMERGNYDSSLALRFNLQPLLYQQLSKVDQDGNPMGNVEFDLYPAEEVSEKTSGAIECLYTDNSVNNGREFYVKQKSGKAYVHLTTASDGSARFLDEQGNYFNFADQGRQYYVLKETRAPDGYRPLPVDIVLYYDPDTSMLSVANRWSTGAYACSVMHNTGTGSMTYGHFDEQTGSIVKDPNKEITRQKQENGLVVAIPMMKRDSDDTWEVLYGSNLGGFNALTIGSDDGADAWRETALRAVLEQAAGDSNPNWSLSWDSENLRLTGTITDLPGLASRYQIVNPDGDMQIIYGIIEPAALQELGISEKDAKDRYAALGEYSKKNGTEKTLQAIMDVKADDAGSGRGFSFLNAGQLTRDFRSLIYIPNEQRELWVMKVDQDGKPRNGARFGLYNNARCTGNPIAQGITATVNGQEGTLIFSPSNDQRDGYAQMMWASFTRTHYYLKELSAPDGCTLNSTVVPVVVGSNSIYADAGKREDGVSVMAGVGRLTQTMRQYAMNNDVDITLRDVTAIQQYQPSKNTEVLVEDWKDTELEGTSDVLRSLNLHFGKNAVVDYGLHDEDGGKLYKPFFVSDIGFVRARVMQNYAALTTQVYENSKSDANKDDLGNTDISNLFSLLNIVVVTDQTEKDTDTGKLLISKTLKGSEFQRADYTKNFTFTIRLTDAKGHELSGKYYFYGTDKAGYVSSGMTFPLHHDEQIVILGLPAGTKYTVTEAGQPGWYPLPKEGAIDGDIIKDATSFATFYNSREPWPEVGFLVLHKTVAGNGDKAKEFTFDVTFKDRNGVRLEKEFPYSGDKTGKISSGQSVTLSHDQYITIFDLPAGTQYAVSEKEADRDGYVTSFHGEDDIVKDGEIHTAAFTNTLEKKDSQEENKEPSPKPGTDGGSGKEDGAKTGSEPKKGSGLSPSDIPNTGDALALLGILSIMSLSGVGAVTAMSGRIRKRPHRGRLLQLRRKKLMRQRRKRFLRRMRQSFRKKNL